MLNAVVCGVHGGVLERGVCLYVRLYSTMLLGTLLGVGLVRTFNSKSKVNRNPRLI